jgi:hypothetical protein
LKWKGRADAFYTQRKDRNIGPGSGTSTAETYNLRRQLIVEPRRPRIDFEQGDLVVFLYRGTQRSGVVVIAEEYDIPNTLVAGSIRLTLRDA